MSNAYALMHAIFKAGELLFKDTEGLIIFVASGLPGFGRSQPKTNLEKIYCLDDKWNSKVRIFKIL